MTQSISTLVILFSPVILMLAYLLVELTVRTAVAAYYTEINRGASVATSVALAGMMVVAMIILATATVSLMVITFVYPI